MNTYLVVYLECFKSDDENESSLGMIIKANSVQEACDLCEEEDDCCYVLAVAQKRLKTVPPRRE